MHTINNINFMANNNIIIANYAICNDHTPTSSGKQLLSLGFVFLKLKLRPNKTLKNIESQEYIRSSDQHGK